MAHPTKIATCCYCGSRTMLRLDTGRHELSCGSCGAPLHRMKALPEAPKPRPRGKTHQTPAAPIGRPKVAKPERVAPKSWKKKKKRKSFLRHMAEEAFDLIEDIFD